MTPIEAARRLAAAIPEHCPSCGAWLRAGGEHAPDCPWLMMPRILAALEAGERVLSDIGWPSPIYDDDDLGISADTARALAAALHGAAPAGDR